jgi:hypothetical protein
MSKTPPTRVVLISGAILLVFVVGGFALAVTELPFGGHQAGGLLLGDTDLGPPWVAVVPFLGGLWLVTRIGWSRRLGAVVVAVCALGYSVAQLTSVTTWFTSGRLGIGIFVVMSTVVGLCVVVSAAWILVRSRRVTPVPAGDKC